MRKLDILVDLDDTLIDLVSHWINCLNYNNKLNVKPEQILSWDITKYFPTLTREQIYKPLYMNKFWLFVNEKPQGSYYINKLLDDGHKITVVTNSNYQTLEYKMTRLFQLYPRLTWDDVIVTGQKYKIKGDVLIDDGRHNLENGDWIKILFHAYHNSLCDTESNGIIRLYSWAEIYGYINNLANQTCKERKAG